jgi:hypothetical protein
VLVHLEHVDERQGAARDEESHQGRAPGRDSGVDEGQLAEKADGGRHSGHAQRTESEHRADEGPPHAHREKQHRLVE